MALEFRLSGGENNLAPNGSLGGQRSNTVITDAVLENIFDNITRNEALQGRTEYRCIYIYNTGAGHLSGVTVEITTNPPLTQLSTGLDPAGKGDGRTNGVATTIATEDTTPTNVKFFGEDILSSDGPFKIVVLPIGLLFSGEGVPIWLKRVTETGQSQEITVNLTANHDAVTLPGDTIDDGGAIGELVQIATTASGTFKIGTARIGFSNIGPT